MKKTYFFLGLMAVALVFSCEKAADHRVGTYVGIETQIEGNYDDTVHYEQVTATYTMVYDKKTKEYSVTSSTNKFPKVTFHRKDFLESHYENSGFWPKLAEWKVTQYAYQQRLVCDYEVLGWSDWRVATFDGIKQ